MYDLLIECVNSMMIIFEELHVYVFRSMFAFRGEEIVVRD